jgi:hypothetical protein
MSVDRGWSLESLCRVTRRDAARPDIVRGTDIGANSGTSTGTGVAVG